MHRKHWERRWGTINCFKIVARWIAVVAVCSVAHGIQRKSVIAYELLKYQPWYRGGICVLFAHSFCQLNLLMDYICLNYLVNKLIDVFDSQAIHLIVEDSTGHVCINQLWKVGKCACFHNANTSIIQLLSWSVNISVRKFCWYSSLTNIWKETRLPSEWHFQYYYHHNCLLISAFVFLSTEYNYFYLIMVFSIKVNSCISKYLHTLQIFLTVSG